MNYCHRCQSHYEKPGTCNCFAEKPAEQPAPVTIPYIPYIPQPWPYYPGTAPWYEPYRITWWVGDPPNATITGGATTYVTTPNTCGSSSYHVSAERVAELQAQGLITYTGLGSA